MVQGEVDKKAMHVAFQLVGLLWGFCIIDIRNMIVGNGNLGLRRQSTSPGEKEGKRKTCSSWDGAKKRGVQTSTL